MADKPKKEATAANGSRPTLRSVAEITGMAVTTVSRALNDAPDISNKTKTIVREAADKIGYRPERSSKHLRTGKSFNIAFINDHADEHPDFARRMILGITTCLVDTNYELFIKPQLRGTNDVDLIRDLVRSQSVDGVIFTHTRPQDDRVKYLLEIDFPFVTHGRTELATQHPYYDLNSYEFTALAAKRLLSKGCQSITQVTPPTSLTSFAHHMHGLSAATRSAGLEPYIFNEPPVTDMDVDALHQLAIKRIRIGDFPDGVICGSELSALAVMDAFQGEGLEIGKDVHFVSRRTSRVLRFVRPRIDTINEDIFKAGETMAQLLLRRFENAPMKELQVLVEPEVDW